MPGDVVITTDRSASTPEWLTQDNNYFVSSYPAYADTIKNIWIAADAVLVAARAMATSTSGTMLAAATSGQIYRSTDGGYLWVAVTGGGSAQAYKIAYVTASIAVLVCSGGVIYRTTDDGLTWTLIAAPGGSTANITDIATDGTNVLLTVTGSVIWKSTNQGVSFAASAAPGGAVVSIAFAGGSTFVCGASGNTRISTNAGASWAAPGSSPALGQIWQAIIAFDALTWVAFGNTGGICRTADGGASWSTITSTGGPGNANSAKIIGGNIAVVTGSTGAQITHDKGLTWAPVPALGAAPAGALSATGTAGGGAYVISWAAKLIGRYVEAYLPGDQFRVIGPGLTMSSNYTIKVKS